MKASEKMRRMRARLVPLSLVVALGVTLPAIWVVMEIIEIAGDPLQWFFDRWEDQKAQLIAFPFEGIAAIGGVIALYRIRPEKPNEIYYMGIDSAGFELINHIFDYLTVALLFVPLYLLLLLDSWIWDAAFAVAVAIVFLALLIFLRLSGARFHADRFYSKIAAPVLAITTPGVGAISKFWDKNIADFIAPYIDDFIDAIPRALSVGI